MLIKEYRIPMPLSVEEYRIAQLYMIQKKSREESQGTESGVEIIENKPYTNGPGGSGQHTQKIYHISKHIPGWLVSLLPKKALIVEEEAWNAYPYTRTRFTCPFVEKFSIDIETRYLNDAGETQNVFDLSATELRNNVIDEIDIVREQSSDYIKDEDPKLYKSKRTGRGPLNEDWLTKMKNSAVEARGKVMCAYKLCKVEFKYWGMQSKIEKFIHDTGLRKVMLRAHKQAWCWQDEWFGLTMDDVRALEKETQLALQIKFGVKEPNLDNSCPDSEDEKSDVTFTSNASFPKTVKPSIDLTLRNGSTSSSLSRQNKNLSQITFQDGGIEGIRRYSTDMSSDDDEFFDATDELPQELLSSSFRTLSSSANRWNSLENISNHDFAEKNLSEDHLNFVSNQGSFESYIYDQNDSYLPSPCGLSILFLILHGGNALESSKHGMQTNKQSDLQTLRSTFDSVINSHYKSAIGRIAMRLVACPVISNEAYQLLQNLSPFGHDNTLSHEQTLPSALVSLFATSSSFYQDTVTSLVVSCNLAYNAFIDSAEGKGFNGQVCIISDTVGSVLGYDMLCRFSFKHNSECNSRRGSSLSNHEEEDDDHPSSVPGSPSFKVSPPQPRWELSANQPALRRGSASQLGGSHAFQSADSSLLSVSLGKNSLQSLSPQRRSSANCCLDIQRSSSYSGSNSSSNQQPPARQVSQPLRGSTETLFKLDFEVSEFFMLGSPLGLILAMRQLSSGNDLLTSTSVAGQATPPKPACHNLYNLFYTADFSSSRVEPLLDMRFSKFPPATVSKYQMFPLGDGQSIAIGDLLTSNSQAFGDSPPDARRASDWSVASGMATDQHSAKNIQQNFLHDNISVSDDAVFSSSLESELNSAVVKRWWGEKRIDYALFYPEALSDFPVGALPHLFHSSFWESADVAAFVLRQVVKHDHVHVRLNDGKDEVCFTPSMPREKWTKRRNQMKLRNSTSNHRARDCIALENQPQVITGRFMYGPLDMYSLNGEKVDIYVLTPPPSAEWVLLSTEVTSSSGKITYTIPESKKLCFGTHPIKMVVRGDHTTADSYLSVLHPDTDCVIFSIDGSFTASVSIMGSDPKVRPGAVDVVRFWQDLGYLIIYITGRPNIMKQRVVTWLSHHNFPKGLIWFGDGLTPEPLKQKATLLKNMMSEHKLNYAAGYGSSKDVSVYSHLGLRPEQIYIVGKTSKKIASQCCVLSEGYSSHLNNLKSHGDVVAAKFNSQIILRKGCIDLPGQAGSKKSKFITIKKKRTTVKSQANQ